MSDHSIKNYGYSVYNLRAVIGLLEDDDFGLSGEEESEFEGEEIASYLSSCVQQLSVRDSAVESDDEAMDVQQLEDLDVLVNHKEDTEERSTDEDTGNS